MLALVTGGVSAAGPATADVGVQALPPPLNPVLANLPPEQVTFQQAFQLGLPVAKNNLLPPAV